MKIRNFIDKFRHFAEDMTGYTSDDTSFSDYAIYEQLISARATIISDKNKKEYFTNAMFQTLTCVMFEEVDASECGLVPPSGCKILKSTCPIPNIIKLVSVTNQLGNQKFDYVRWDQIDGKINSRIPSVKDATYYTIRNIGSDQYIYIINNSNLKNAVVVAIFEDPVKAAQFCANSGGDPESLCNPLDLDFHTDMKIEDAIMKLTFDLSMYMRKAAKPDILNDDSNLQ